mmetsp:Transcript_2005/g.6522  ORF Transcript_2005/g.6522 Transcript_2005/m.6522 type:complete len:105 (-) Transcript_2005:131-445(-)
MFSTIPTEIGMLTALKYLRVPPASPTPGAARDRPSVSQVPQRQQDLRPDPGRVRQAREAGVPDPRRQQQDLRHVPARSLRRQDLRRQERQRPRPAVRLDGLLRS